MQNYEKEFLNLIKQRYFEKHGHYSQEVDHILAALQKTKEFQSALARYVSARFKEDSSKSERTTH